MIKSVLRGPAQDSLDTPCYTTPSNCRTRWPRCWLSDPDRLPNQVQFLRLQLSSRWYIIIIKALSNYVGFSYMNSWAKSLDRLHFLRPILMTSIHVLFGLALFHEGSSTCIGKLFIIDVVVGLVQHVQTISNESLNLSPIDVTTQ